MANVNTWLKAARPRTVLLSLSGILMGDFLAFYTTPDARPWTLALCALTAICLQILSNLANDYGDFVKGVDNAHRKGPQRSLQSGAITQSQMRAAIGVMAAAALASGAVLLFLVARLSLLELAVFAALGLGAVVAALLYTLGKHPYGYRGLGDLYCFIFFGWVAVAGSFYLTARLLDLTVLLPATTMGCLSNAVLNINNMRDYANDKASGKNSLVVKIGLKNAFVYHCLLIGMVFTCLTLYLLLKQTPWYAYCFWLLFPLFLKDLSTIRHTLSLGVDDPLLPKQVRNTFLITLVFGVALLMV